MEAYELDAIVAAILTSGTSGPLRSAGGVVERYRETLDALREGGGAVPVKIEVLEELPAT